MNNSLSISLNESVNKSIKEELHLMLQENDCFLHLGCRDGSLAASAAQFVGAGGKVIGLEQDPSSLRDIYGMLSEIADNLGYDNMYFYQGNSYELRTDLYRQSTLFKRININSFDELTAFSNRCVEYFNNNPVVVADSVKVLLSSIDLTKLPHFQVVELLHEMARVLLNHGSLVMTFPNQDSQFSKNVDEYLRIMEGAGFENIQYLPSEYEMANCCGTTKLDVIKAQRIERNIAIEQTCSKTSSCC